MFAASDPSLGPVQARPHLSVIVPLAPGEREWRGLLTDLAALRAGSEIVLVHAEPPAERVASPNSDVRLVQIQSLPGRGRQLNLGARHAGGRWLWFLHADSRLDAHAVGALTEVLDRDRDALAWFDLGYRADGPALTRLNACGANWRARRLGLPFGDQGFALPAARFAALGGFDEHARSGEDHLLVWAARAAGLPLMRVNAVITTSARKYARHGWLRTTLHHAGLTLHQAWTGWRRNRAARTPAELT